MNLLNEQIPGYQEALAKETLARDAAFIGLTETVCGVEIRQMTALDFVRLDICGSAFIRGTQPDPIEIARFLWALSPQFSHDNPRARKRFVKSLRHLPFVETVKAIREYISDTFMDGPSTTGNDSVGHCSWLALIIDLLAREYHWTEDIILNLPLKRIFQYQRAIRMRLDPKAALFNPSDSIRGRWLQTLNSN